MEHSEKWVGIFIKSSLIEITVGHKGAAFHSIIHPGMREAAVIYGVREGLIFWPIYRAYKRQLD